MIQRECSLVEVEVPETRIQEKEDPEDVEEELYSLQYMVILQVQELSQRMEQMVNRRIQRMLRRHLVIREKGMMEPEEVEPEVIFILKMQMHYQHHFN